MANSTLILTTNSFSLANYLGESSSVLNINDSTNVFNVFYLKNNNNTLNINTVSDIDFSKYIKKSQDVFNITSSSYIEVAFTDNISETILFSDETSVISTTQSDLEDNIILRTKSELSVNYTPEELSDTINFTDICNLLTIISNKKIFKNAIYSLVGNSTTVYTCNEKESIIINISLCNRTLNDIKTDVSINNSSGLTYIGKEITIKPHQTFVINNNEDNNIQLLNGDSITIQSDTPSSVDVLISVLETV